jgi:hypothetical protein
MPVGYCALRLLTPPPGAAPESGRTIADAQDGATKKEI